MCWRVLAVTLKGAWAVAVCFFLSLGPHNLSLCVLGRTTPGGSPYSLGALRSTKNAFPKKKPYSCVFTFFRHISTEHINENIWLTFVDVWKWSIMFVEHGITAGILKFDCFCETVAWCQIPMFLSYFNHLFLPSIYTQEKWFEHVKIPWLCGKDHKIWLAVEGRFYESHSPILWVSRTESPNR